MSQLAFEAAAREDVYVDEQARRLQQFDVDPPAHIALPYGPDELGPKDPA